MRLVDVDDVWGSYRHIVSEIVEPCRLTADMIYDWCFMEWAHIFQVEEGFFIVKPQLGIDGKRVLNVLVAYGKGVNLFEKYSENIQQLARDINATRIEFSSNRPGWSKLAKKCGYVPRETIYELEVLWAAEAEK